MATPFERLQQLIGLIDLSPTKSQIVAFLSQHVCPDGELSGISWMSLNQDGVFEYENVRGLVKYLDPEIKVSVTDDNVVALAARTGKTQMFDMQQMYSTFKQATHREMLSHYASGIVLPVTDKQYVGIVLTGSIEKLRPYSEYFECVRLVLALWHSRESFNQSKLAKKEKLENLEITERQKAILELIREGRTNASIASKMGYSESLIRQESIIIYRKLGIAGRSELREIRGEISSNSPMPESE